MRDLYWQSDAWLEYVDLQKDKALCQKINNLIKDICGMVIRLSMERLSC